MNRKSIVSILIAALTLALSITLYRPTVNAQDATAEATSAVQGQYASVNGLDMYYEVYGAQSTGEPLILLHGGLGGIVEYAQLLPLLAQNRQVIAVELQGHGHTADVDRPITYEGMADDMAAFIKELGFEKADVMGYSLGGGVALRTAIQHPDVVRKLVLISTPFRQSGIHEEFQAGMSAMNAEAAESMKQTPMYQYYSSVAPKLEDWSTFVGKVGELVSQDYDWTEDVKAMTTPTLIVLGDSDMLYAAHAVEMFGLLGGNVPSDFVGPVASQLAVLPGTSHFTILSRADLLLPVLMPFLDAPPAPAS